MRITENILWLALTVVLCTVGIAAAQYVVDCWDLAHMGR